MSILNFIKNLFVNNTNNNSNYHIAEKLAQSQKILQDYAAGRYTPLDIDLDKIDLSGDRNQNSNIPEVLPKNMLKRSNIPIYTGNPFNPYF